MKKVFFALASASVLFLASCNNKPAGGTDAAPADSTAASSGAAKTEQPAAAPAATDSSAAKTDSTASK